MMIKVRGTAWKTDQHLVEVQYYFRLKNIWYCGVCCQYLSIHKRFNIKSLFKDGSAIFKCSTDQLDIIKTRGLFMWEKVFEVEEEELKRLFHIFS